MADSALLKHQLDSAAIRQISEVLSELLPDFAGEAFCQAAVDGLEPLELKQRVNHLVTVLGDFLPQDFTAAAAVLKQVKSHWPEPIAQAGWNNNYAAWPLIDYVERYGLLHPVEALAVLKTLTPLFTAEFAIRSFIRQHFELTYETLLQWCDDSDAHVRRLASEGIRPRLPWAQHLQRLKNDPRLILPILNKLKDDTSDYVRRSVANNLNDISKDHPQLVLGLCHDWQQQITTERHKLIRHALRTLVKAGNVDALALQGYTIEPQYQLRQFSVRDKKLRLEQPTQMSAELTATAETMQQWLLEYRIGFSGKGKTLNKRYRWNTLDIAPQQAVKLDKVLIFKQLKNRGYISGDYAIELLLNGVAIAKTELELTVK